ncbi:MAG: hypothetical protein EOP48_12745, partial [Sphingobacteriales bacterium]
MIHLSSIPKSHSNSNLKTIPMKNYIKGNNKRGNVHFRTVIPAISVGFSTLSGDIRGIEISNPGKLLPTKKIDRLIRTSPESRNEILAAAFRRYNICEERGSGFEKS